MFESELKVLDRLDDLTYDLSNQANDAMNSVDDMQCAVDDLRAPYIYIFSPDPNAATDRELNQAVNDIVASGRQAARDLAKFDRTLLEVIALRRQLGDFEITL